MIEVEELSDHRSSIIDHQFLGEVTK